MNDESYNWTHLGSLNISITRDEPAPAKPIRWEPVFWITYALLIIIACVATSHEFLASL